MAGTLIGRLLVGTQLDSSGFQRGAAKGTKHLTAFERRTKKVGASINRTMGALGAAFAVSNVIANAARTVSEFDQKVANLAATTGRTKSDMGNLVENAKAIGAVSAFSASQVLDLQTELAKLGNTEKEIISMTKSVGDFSIAVGATTAEAATLAGGVLKSFNRTAQDTESTVSTLAVATTKSALDFNKLATALPIVGTAADQSGVSLERTTALLGVLADRNIDASTAGTALRNIFLELKARGLTYNQAMSRINGSTDKLNEANKLFGKRGAVVATVLATSGEQADKLEQSITGVDDALKQMTDERLETLQNQMTLAKSAWEVFVLSVESGDGIISKAVKGVVGGFTSIVSTLTEINKGGILNDREQGLNNFILLAFGTDEDRERVISHLDKIRKKQSDIEKGFLTSGGNDRTSLYRGRFEKKEDPLADEIKNLGNETDKGKTKVISLSSEIRKLNTEVTTLSESYIRGGENDNNILNSILSKQAKIRELNTDLQKSIELTNRLSQGERGTITAPESIGSVGLAQSLSPQTAKNNEKVSLDGGFLKRAIDDTRNLQESNEALAESYRSLGQAIGDSLASGANSFGEFASKALKSIQKTVGGLLKLFIAKSLSTAIGTGPFGLFAAGAIGGLAEGIFNTAINSAKVPALAEGGVIKKPTYAMLGEYPGASNNPEIAAPESKLKSIFGGEIRKLNGGGMGNINTKLFGDDIYLSNKRATYTAGRTG